MRVYMVPLVKTQNFGVCGNENLALRYFIKPKIILILNMAINMLTLIH